MAVTIVAAIALIALWGSEEDQASAAVLQVVASPSTLCSVAQQSLN